MTKVDGSGADEASNFADWDSQFFISFGEENALADGDQIQVTMEVKADVAQSGIGTQSHLAPGGYIHWACIGNVNFTTDWEPFDSGVLTAGDAPKTGCYTIALNLAKGAENTFYFKNIVVKIKKAVAITSWTNLIANGDLEGDDNSCFATTEQGIGGPFKAVIEDFVGKNGSRGIMLQSDDDPATDWSTQFFLRLPKKLPSGTKYRVSFDYMADQPGADFDTQAHNAPGGYIHWACIGSGTFPLDWDTYQAEGTISGDMSKADNLMYSIAFNLAKNKIATKFYIDNIVFEVPEDVVATLEDSPENTLGTGNPSIAGFADDMVTYVAPCGIKKDNSFDAYAAKYNDETGYVDLFNVGDEIPAKEAVILDGVAGLDVEETRVHVLPYEDGFNDLLASDGTVTSDGSIYVLADGANGVGFYALAYGQDVPAGKGYLKIDVLGRAFIGLQGEATAIKAVERAVKEGVVFNLAGQRVAKAQKGLNIQNGKKYIK